VTSAEVPNQVWLTAVLLQGFFDDGTTETAYRFISDKLTDPGLVQTDTGRGFLNERRVRLACTGWLLGHDR